VEYRLSTPVRQLRLAIVPALLGLMWSAGDASAQSCRLSLLNSLPLTLTDNFASVPASVGTKEMQFQIGTASPDNQMGKEAVSDFGLSTVEFDPSQNGDGGAGAFSAGQLAGTNIDGAQIGRSQFGSIGGGMPGNAIPIYNSKGVMFHTWADARPFTLGSMRTDHLQFVVTDIPNPGSGGILSAGFFDKYDMDLNFGAHKMNLFASDHCDGQVLYWRAPAVARLPFRYKNGQITVRVTIDGREMDAVIDTGFPRTELQFDDADSFFFLSARSPGVTREGNFLAYNFGGLSFGDGVTIFHPHIVLTHSAGASGLNAGPQTGTLLRNFGTAAQPALTIGNDLLKQLHVYIAFKERMVYVTQGPELPAGDARALPVVAVTPFRP
jgi:hypothetical protein